MPESMPFQHFTTLEWNPAPMPQSSGAVQLAQLPDLGDGAFRAFVRFPAGWERAAHGHYEVAEEFLVLQGALSFNEHTWQAGAYGWIAARRARHLLRTEGGCLVFAWFGGAPRWRRGDPATPALDADLHHTSWRDAPLQALPGGGEARQLHANPHHSTCIIEQPTPAVLAGLPATSELLALGGYAWCANTAANIDAWCASPVLARRRSDP